VTDDIQELYLLTLTAVFLVFMFCQFGFVLLPHLIVGGLPRTSSRGDILLLGVDLAIFLR